eukprot:m.40394 g.40394  ORF g.40394 m.40394 type:complete len:338 (+) comp11361_c0_seq2:133-1146(+)
MSVRRSLKNLVHSYTASERAVREATSNDTWGASSTLMAKIAVYTQDLHECPVVMAMIWRRMDDHIPKNWRHVYKSLVLVDYLVKNGSDQAVHLIKENLFAFQTLRDFQFMDSNGKDQGVNVRERARSLLALLANERTLQEERARAQQAHARVAASHSPSTPRATSRKQPQHRLMPDAAPTGSSDPAIERQREAHRRHLVAQHQAQQMPAGPVDEEEQLALALSMSVEEEAQRQRLRELEEQQLAVALTESKETPNRTSAWGSQAPVENPPQASPGLRRVVVAPTERWSPPKQSPPRPVASSPTVHNPTWSSSVPPVDENNPFLASDAPASNPFSPNK